ncbi:hypothetical protein ACFL02_08250 [Planctomycetota bacterium]
MDRKEPILQALSYIDWHGLDLNAMEEKRAVGNSTANRENPDNKIPDNIKVTLNLPPHENLLACDVIAHLDRQFGERIEATSISARMGEVAKKGLIGKRLIKEIFIGKSLFLAPTYKLYQLFGMKSPYKRNVPGDHAFLVLLAAKLVESHPLIQRIKTEVSLGDSNATVDLVAYFKDGQRCAYEITLSATNVAANAAKLQGKNFSQIIFLCRDFNIKEAVWASLRNAGFAPDFFATIRCTIFSTLIRQRKQMKLKKS